jgi:hypothetical protein
VITIIYQYDSNIPFDGMAETAHNQPPWPAVSASLMNLPSVQDCCARQEISFPVNLGFQERIGYGYNSREHYFYGRLSGKSAARNVRSRA